MDPMQIANLAMTGIAVGFLGLSAWQKRRQAAGKPQLLPDLSGMNGKGGMPSQPQAPIIIHAPPASPPLVAQPQPSLFADLGPIIAQLVPVALSFIHVNAPASGGTTPTKPAIDLAAILQVVQQLLNATPPVPTPVAPAKAA